MRFVLITRLATVVTRLSRIITIRSMFIAAPIRHNTNDSCYNTSHSVLVLSMWNILQLLVNGGSKSDVTKVY